MLQYSLDVVAMSKTYWSNFWTLSWATWTWVFVTGDDSSTTFLVVSFFDRRRLALLSCLSSVIILFIKVRNRNEIKWEIPVRQNFRIRMHKLAIFPIGKGEKIFPYFEPCSSSLSGLDEFRLRLQPTHSNRSSIPFSSITISPLSYYFTILLVFHLDESNCEIFRCDNARSLMFCEKKLILQQKLLVYCGKGGKAKFQHVVECVIVAPLESLTLTLAEDTLVLI